MSQTCTRCGGTGFLNAEQIPDGIPEDTAEATWADEVVKWLQGTTEEHDVEVCGCCGDGVSEHHGMPGEHYTEFDPPGPDGPYAYNGGLCECD